MFIVGPGSTPTVHPPSRNEEDSGTDDDKSQAGSSRGSLLEPRQIRHLEIFAAQQKSRHKQE